MSKKTLRCAAALGFLAMVVVGLLWPIGWGTLSSFGWREIAYLCPVGALEVMAADRTLIPRAVIALVVVVGITLLLGRVFCGWVCPVPWLQRFMRKLTERKVDNAAAPASKTAEASGVIGPEEPEGSAPGTTKGSCTSSPACVACTKDSVCSSSGKVSSCSGQLAQGSDEAGADNPSAPSKTPYVILGGALASSAVFGFPVFCLVCPVGLVFAIVIGLWRLFVSNDPDTALLLFIGILGLETLVLRRWCANFCPIGAFFSIVSRWNRRLRPVAGDACVRRTENAACTRCRDVCPEGLDPAAVAKDPKLWSRCTKCGVCQAACLSGAIRFPWSAKTAGKSSEKTAEKTPKKKTEEQNAPAHRVIPVVPASALPDASLCTHCASCGEACPEGTLMPEIVTAAQKGELSRARALLLAPGRLPEITGRICPSTLLCEGACSHGVPVAGIETRLADAALDEVLSVMSGKSDAAARSKMLTTYRAPVTKRVAVVGSGPAGLACADALIRNGFAVDVFEAADRPGGLLAKALLPGKLPPEVLDRRVTLLERLGVRFILKTRIGSDIPWATLSREYDAVFAALGAGPGVRAEIPGTDEYAILPDGDPSNHFVLALDLLEDRILLRNALPTMRGLTVLILGGGDTALDVARLARDEGAARVALVTRRKADALRCNPTALAALRREGVELLDERQAVGVSALGANGTADSHAGRLSVTLTTLGRSGTSEKESLPCDLIVTAYGQRLDPAEDFSALGLAVRPDGRGVEKTGKTEGTVSALPNLWAGGDFTRGASLAVYAVADGREAARQIGRALGVRVRLEPDD